MIDVKTVNLYLKQNDKPANQGYLLKDAGEGNFIAQWNVDGLAQPTNEQLSALAGELEQARILKALSYYRESKILNGITTNGITIEGDDKTQIRLAGARIEAESNPDYVVKWKATSGEVELNAAQVIALSSALRQHIQKCFDVYFIIEKNSYNTAQEAIDAYELEFNK